MADELLTAAAYEATIDHVTAYLAVGPPSQNVQGKRLAANKRLERWRAAIEDADALVRADPTDSDFWWWRGEIHELSGDYARALVDYQQSLAVEVSEFPARKLSWLPDAAGTYRCPAVFAIKRYVVTKMPKHTSWESRMRDLYVAGACDDQAGRKATRLVVPAGVPVKRVRVVVEGIAAELTFNPFLGVTVLSRALAERAGIEVAGPPVGIYVNGTHLAATLTTVSGGGEGVLAADFTWRFNQVETGTSVSLTSWVD